MKAPTIIIADFESVFIPEIWPSVGEKVGIKELRLSTRDVSNYDQLMRGRLKILSENNLSLEKIQSVIKTLKPLEGAVAFMDWLRARYPVIILSDSYYEFAGAFMEAFRYPTLLCNTLEADTDGRIIDYHLSAEKEKVVRALKGIGFRVMAVGDSYNDTAMFKAADFGIFFNCSKNVADEFPQFPSFQTYEEVQQFIESKA